MTLSLDRILTLILIVLMGALILLLLRLSERVEQLSVTVLSDQASLRELIPAGVFESGRAESAGHGSITNTVTGNTVTVQHGAGLPDGPRTVEQVADYLGVTPDTVRESYIPMWIETGEMSDGDKLRNRWLIPETFTPYRPR